MQTNLTILGGNGFVGGNYVKHFYDPAVGNIASVNARDDYEVHSKDVLNFISTVTNYNVFEQVLLDINTNLITLMRILENWRKRSDSDEGVFNFISSWFVYGEQPSPLSVREDAHCNPRGFYSITKRCAEQLLISYCETYNLHYRILRLGNVLGPGDKKVGAKKNALQYMINLLAANKPIEIYGNGLFHRDYIHVDDCVRAIDLVIAKGEVDNIYNIGNGVGKFTSAFRDIIMYAARELRSGSVITYVPAKKFHSIVQVATFGMDVSKLWALGYVPEYVGSRLYDTLLPIIDVEGIIHQPQRKELL
jgi:nucleoside-diphosphate-sugar epimerase